ncbi:hypothetical protein F4808DRAFT_422267 [Astrocystis sublimbata]|nr:hypothetical protein F4808DRAFT_422267 [Astrocystis sublimbata]
MMTWHETDQKGVFSRPIGENEAFIKLLGDVGLPLNREHWAINSTATIIPTGSMAASVDLASHFRRAWAHLRFQHPSLAAESAPDNKNLIYTVPSENENPLDVWVARTFSVATGSSADVIATLQPTPYAQLVYIPRSSELLFHTSHWRSDGIGVILLLDALLSIASTLPLADPASLPWSSEIERLAPSIEDAAAVPKDSTPASKERSAVAVRTFAHAASLYTTGWMKRVDSSSSWSERLGQYQNEYRKGITRDFLDSHREYAVQLGEMVRNALSQSVGGVPPSDVDISSIGVCISRKSFIPVPGKSCRQKLP